MFAKRVIKLYSTFLLFCYATFMIHVISDVRLKTDMFFLFVEQTLL